jgi:D-beta-D-heptose 7-phosphate kinase/D-beta-D-heptose 1-phosphate adenosyltransferase
MTAQKTGQVMSDGETTMDLLGRPGVLVLGDIMLDRYTWGHADRVSPEAPVLVMRADWMNDEARSTQ